jgi:hypothetical protein
MDCWFGRGAKSSRLLVKLIRMCLDTSLVLSDLREEKLMNVARNHGCIIDFQSAQPAVASQEICGRRKGLFWSRWPLFTLMIVTFFSMGHLAGAYQRDQDILRIKSITAEKYEVRSPDDKLKASLYQGPAGEVYLTFFDRNGGSRLTMGVGPKGAPAISFFDDKLAPRMILSLDADDSTPQIILFDGQNGPALHLGVTKGFGPDISIGKPGQGRISISAREGGSPAIQIFDPKNNPRISLDLSDNDKPAISILGDDRVIRASWRLHTDGAVIFSLLDAKARQRLVVMTDKDGKPSIRFIDPDKNEAKAL